MRSTNPDNPPARCCRGCPNGSAASLARPVRAAGAEARPRTALRPKRLPPGSRARTKRLPARGCRQPRDPIGVDEMLSQGRYALLLRPAIDQEPVARAVGAHARRLGRWHVPGARGQVVDAPRSRRQSNQTRNRPSESAVEPRRLLSRPLPGDQRPVLPLRGHAAATSKCRSGIRRSGRRCSTLSTRRAIPARGSGRTAAFRAARNTIRWSASAGTRPWPMPAGSASGCRAMPNGSRRAVGRCRSRGIRSCCAAIRGAKRWTAAGRICGARARAEP